MNKENYNNGKPHMISYNYCAPQLSLSIGWPNVFAVPGGGSKVKRPAMLMYVRFNVHSDDQCPSHLHNLIGDYSNGCTWYCGTSMGMYVLWQFIVELCLVLFIYYPPVLNQLLCIYCCLVVVNNDVCRLLWHYFKSQHC